MGNLKHISYCCLLMSVISATKYWKVALFTCRYFPVLYWPKDCWRDKKGNDWICRKLVKEQLQKSSSLSLFGPLVILIHVLLIKKTFQFHLLKQRCHLPCSSSPTSPAPSLATHRHNGVRVQKKSSHEQLSRAREKIHSRGMESKPPLLSSSCSRSPASLSDWPEP